MPQSFCLLQLLAQRAPPPAVPATSHTVTPPCLPLSLAVGDTSVPHPFPIAPPTACSLQLHPHTLCYSSPSGKALIYTFCACSHCLRDDRADLMLFFLSCLCLGMFCRCALVLIPMSSWQLPQPCVPRHTNPPAPPTQVCFLKAFSPKPHTSAWCTLAVSAQEAFGKSPQLYTLTFG